MDFLTQGLLLHFSFARTPCARALPVDSGANFDPATAIFSRTLRHAHRQVRRALQPRDTRGPSGPDARASWDGPWFGIARRHEQPVGVAAEAVLSAARWRWPTGAACLMSSAIALARVSFNVASAWLTSLPRISSQHEAGLLRRRAERYLDVACASTIALPYALCPLPLALGARRRRSATEAAARRSSRGTAAARSATFVVWPLKECASARAHPACGRPCSRSHTPG